VVEISCLCRAARDEGPTRFKKDLAVGARSARTAYAVHVAEPTPPGASMVAHEGSGRNSQPVPNDSARNREAQDRSKGRSGQATSPVDAKHVDAPDEQDNERGHQSGAKRTS